MNNQEAKFILGAYRPDGRDAADPGFATALAQMERDPELRGWFERQRKFDLTVTRKLQDIAPPPELKAAILAGARASRPRPAWWSNPFWLAAAAVLALITALGVSTLRPTQAPALARLTAFALKDLAEEHDAHVGYPPEFAELQLQLATTKLPLAAPGAVVIDLEDLRRKNCRRVRVAGRDVFEICFQRDGTWYHLYAAQRGDFAPAGGESGTSFASAGEYVAATWIDSKNVYALVARAAEQELRRLI